jgi:hypothetical protein
MRSGAPMGVVTSLALPSDTDLILACHGSCRRNAVQ